jgi:hypothetical protein
MSSISISTDTLLLVFLIVFCVQWAASLIISIIVIRDTTATKQTVDEVASKTGKIDYLLQQLITNMQLNHMETSFNDVLKEQQFNRGLPQGRVLYKSLDGKHTAATIEELFEKISNDPSSGINAADLEALRKFFEQISRDDEPLDDEEDDDGVE